MTSPTRTPISSADGTAKATSNTVVSKVASGSQYGIVEVAPLGSRPSTSSIRSSRPGWKRSGAKCSSAASETILQRDVSAKYARSTMRSLTEAGNWSSKRWPRVSTPNIADRGSGFTRRSARSWMLRSTGAAAATSSRSALSATASSTRGARANTKAVTSTSVARPRAAVRSLRSARREARSQAIGQPSRARRTPLSGMRARVRETSATVIASRAPASR